MALRAGYYGVKRFLRDKLETIAGTYDETIKSLFPRSEQAVLGAKNLIQNVAVTKEENGLTFTRNNDGTITINGTATATTFYTIQNSVYVDDSYILNGCPFGGATNSYAIRWNTGGTNLYDTGNGVLIPKGTATALSIEIRIENGATLNNLVFKPMLRLATDPDDTYVPYAMTNKELTNSAADQKTAINAIITAATGAADFAAFKTAMGAITPVTRSLLLTKEDITEEVKEDVEPEKTVTKKRTTKKTEEV